MMKKNFIVFIFCLLAAVSCTKNNPSKPTGLTEEVTFEQVGTIESIGLMEHYELMIQQSTAGNADEDPGLLAYLQEQLDAAEDYTDECLNQSGANWGEGYDGKKGKNGLLGYQYATIRYKSIDHNGNPADLSALVVWPYNNIFSNPDPNNVIIGCHVTISSNAERPSNYNANSVMTDVGMLACCAKSNGAGSSYENLVIIPDYQGYGATHGEVHPYLSQDLTARQVLDGVRAGIAYYTQKIGKLEKGWRSVSTGYSQGGSVAMAVHRYIEKNNLVSDFNFAGSVCGSGPYDPLATLKKYVKMEYVYMPVAAAMMMYSMCKTSPRLKGKYDLDDFLPKSFTDTGIIGMIEDKQLNTDEIQDSLLRYSAKVEGYNSGKFFMERKEKGTSNFYEYIKDTKDMYKWEPGLIKTARAAMNKVLERESHEYFYWGGRPQFLTGDYKATKALIQALEDNVLHRDWTPAHPIFLYHTEEDEVVVIDNYQECLKAWEGSDMVKAAIYKGATETHVSYGKYFYLFHCGQGIKAILNGKVDDYPFSRTIKGEL